MAAIESRTDELLLGAVWQKVAGEVFDCELVEVHVLVEGVDHPVAIGPHLAIVVHMDAVRVGVACVIQPVAAAVLAPASQLQ